MQRVELSLRRAGGNYWNGSSFGSATETWVTATGTTSWSYGFPAGSFPADGTYVLHARAIDTAGNVEDFSATTFTFDGTAPTGSITAPTAQFVHGNAVVVASDSADTGGSGVQQAVFEVSPAGAGSWSTIGTRRVAVPSGSGATKRGRSHNASRIRSARATSTRITRHKRTRPPPMRG